MITVDAKPAKGKAALAQLLLGTPEKGKGDNFARMLASMADAKGNPLAKEALPAQPQIGLLLANDTPDVVAAETPPAAEAPAGKNSDLLKLLHADAQTGEHEAQEGETAVPDRQQLLNPKLADMPPKALAAVIQQAKQYLKTEIAKVSEIKELPKTLEGLARLAQKVGIDLTKITVETVTEQPRTPRTGEKLPEQSRQKQAAETKELPVKNTAAQKNDAFRALPLFTQKPAPMTTEQIVARPERSAGTEMPGTAQAEEPTLPKPLESLLRQASEAPAKTAAEPKESVRKNTKQPAAPAAAAAKTGDAADMPVQSSVQKAAKLFEHTPSAAQTKPLENLERLLHGDSGRESRAETSEAGQSGEIKHTSALQQNGKTDALNLKVAEARQMVQHFASEIKEAVENYKPPFTRLKMKLNPVKLGEVDVTMVQRGSNVHINITSNSVAITTLMQNAAELKTQLAQNGLANATMNFTGGGAEQQQRQNAQQQLAQHYENFENYEESAELYSALELIVPRYI